MKQSIIRIGLYSIFTPLEKRADSRGRLPLEYPLFTIVICVFLNSFKIPSFQLQYICSIYSILRIYRCLTGPNQLYKQGYKVLKRGYRDRMSLFKHVYFRVYEIDKATNANLCLKLPQFPYFWNPSFFLMVLLKSYYSRYSFDLKNKSI